MGLGANIDSGVTEGLLWQVYESTYSINKIPQTGIVKPTHPLLNKKMLAQPSVKIISSTEHSA
jgi:hypothetical protein